MNTEKTKVMLCVLSGDGFTREELADWRLTMQGESLAGNFPFEFQFHSIIGASPIEHARNMAVEDFLKSDCEKLWFVDADMVPLHTSHLVLASEMDITVGPCPMFVENGGTHKVAPNLFWVQDDFYKIWEVGDECSAGGTANMAITRRVLESPDMRTENGGVFRRVAGDLGQIKVGEDVDFCTRAQKNGFTFGVAWNATMGHVKSLDIDVVTSAVRAQFKTVSG